METKKEYSETEYLNIILDFAKKHGPHAVLMLRCLPWLNNRNEDRFFGTTRGLYRYFSVLSLEFLFRKILKKGGDWSKGHSLMCREVELTNIIPVIHAARIRGYYKDLPEEAIKLEDKIFKTGMNTMLNMMFRGWFKTTLFSSAWSIQETVIDPDSRILIVSGSLDTAQSILTQTKSHFVLNEDFRYIFPDYCPKPSRKGKIEFGTMDEFTLPNRLVHDVREPTFKAASPTTKLTGYHFTKMVIDDIIDEKNCTNEEQIENAKNMFQIMLSLFDKPAKPYYVFSGTHYHFADLYRHLKLTHSNDGVYESRCYNPVNGVIEIINKKVA